MWGNRLGWGISAAMVIVYAGAMVMFNLALRVSPPTGTIVAASPELPISPDAIVAPGTEPGDAGTLYLQALDDYRTNYFTYDQFTNDSKATVAQGLKLPGVGWILDARSKAECSMFKDKPDLVVTYQPGKTIDSVRALGNVMTMLGLRAALGGKPTDAIKYHEAAFTLGRWLVTERVVYAEYSAGLGIVGGSAKALADLYRKRGDKDRAKKFDDFNTSRIDYERDTIQPVVRVLTSVDPAVIKKYPGDIFAIAVDSSDPMWRVQGVLKLGMMRYYAGRTGDQRAALRTARVLADTDANPAVRMAAVKARDLTLEEYKMLN